MPFQKGHKINLGKKFKKHPFKICLFCKKKFRKKYPNWTKQAKFCDKKCQGKYFSWERNVLWKGNNVGIKGLHFWVKRWIKKRKRCQFCNKIKPLDLANKSGKLIRDLDNWLFLCRSCHFRYDKHWLKRKRDKFGRRFI